jgi:hypothetical protein
VSVAPKVAGFAGALALLFGAGALAGGVVDPSAPRAKETDAVAEMHAKETDAMAGMRASGPHEKAMPVRGLAVAENGLRLVVATPAFERGRTAQLRFRIVDERGSTVRDFDTEHTKRMHLIVVRRDLTGFQHLHPVQDARGEWTTPLRLGAAGSYRVYADFSHDGKPTTLASDLRVDGTSTLVDLPAPAAEAASDGGYSVRLQRTRARAGSETTLRFTVLRDGKPVEVEPYLGANGHLVALREGDLAFLHVHPAQGVTFESTFPTTGRYRLFLQFKHAGRVHTSAFTQEVM